MKNAIFILVAILYFKLSATSQQYVRMIAGQSIIQSYESKPGSNTTTSRDVTVSVEYWGTNANDIPVPFAISNVSAGASVINPTITTIGVFSIPKAKFKPTRDTIIFLLHITINATNALAVPEIFDIYLNGLPSTDPIHRVSIQNEPAKNAKILLKGGRYDLSPLYDKSQNPKNDSVPIQLCLSGNFDANNNTVHFFFDTLGLPNHPSLYPGTITINENTWNSVLSSGGVLQTSVMLETRFINDTLKGNEFGSIRIKEDSSDSVVVWLTNKINPNKPFWIEIGANFDISNGFQPTNFYSGIFLFKKDVAKFPFFHPKSNNLSILGGVYESKNITSDLSSDKGLVYRDGLSYINDPTKGYPIFSDTGNINATVTSTNVGLFFSPQIRLTNRPSDEDGVHIFLSLWTEMLWQRLETNYDYSKLNSVSGNTTYVQTIDAVNLYSTKLQKSIQDYRSHYFGLGLPIYFKYESANLYINPIFWGLTSQKFTVLRDLEKGNTVKQNPSWSDFYLLQFRLSEEKYGFAFTGEIRGLYQGNNKPSISLTLSKKFDLSRIGDYISKLIKY
jgi:hypothetical protein